MHSLVPGHACHHCKGHWSPHPAFLTPPLCHSLAYSHTHARAGTRTNLHPHAGRTEHTKEKRLVWRSLAHLSLYQAVSPSLQRRCRFEECATVGRMNLHDELGIYLFIFHQAAPRHIPVLKKWFPYTGQLQILYPLKATSLMMIAPPLSRSRIAKQRFVSLMRHGVRT